MSVFSKRTGCVSCHHEGIGRWATGFAKEHGFAIDTALAQAQDKKIAGFLNPAEPLIKAAVADPSQIKNVPIVDVGDLVPLYTSLFNGVAEHGTKTELTGLSDSAVVLNRVQTPDGCWSFGFHRVPMQSSQFTMTALTIRLLKLYAPESAQAEVNANLERARKWLITAPVKDNEDRAFRLLGLKWAGASADEISKAVKMMYTDPNHLRVDDPGQVEGNVVFSFLDAFDPDTAKIDELKAHYRRGGLGDSVLKKMLNERLQEVIAPIRAERERLAKDRGEMLNVLRRGTERARATAAQTLSEVKAALGLNYFG